MTLTSPAFLSPASLSLEQVHQLLLLSIRDQHPEWVTPEGDCPACDSYERKLGELAAMFFKGLPRPKRGQS
jgi:hypothetical protein